MGVNAVLNAECIFVFLREPVAHFLTDLERRDVRLRFRLRTSQTINLSHIKQQHNITRLNIKYS